jgi:hypothetical protein
MSCHALPRQGGPGMKKSAQFAKKILEFHKKVLLWWLSPLLLGDWLSSYDPNIIYNKY